VGEWVMLGAYTAFWFQEFTGADPMAALPLFFALFFGSGYLLQPLIQRVTAGKRPRPVLMGLLFTFGLATVAKGSALYFWGFNFRSVRTWLSGQNIQIGITVPSLRFAGFLFGVLTTVAFMAFLYWTRTGRAVRATAQDRVTAGLLGVDVRRISAFVYAVYAGLTGMAGVLIGALFSIHAGMGLRYTTLAFFVVVLAGMGFVPGVIPAALFMGLLQSLTAVYLGSRYVGLALFGVFYLTLVVAPKGLFGRGS
ncbi:MAG: branched-chain amino acid ABC transporter permease, partial [candidate division NC10 bacterium]|nr:branched-chain amino acid ABC transporter permease [candidate division NC10 bacterium]